MLPLPAAELERGFSCCCAPYLIAMVLESPNIPPHPSQDTVLNASNLELLGTPREENRVQEFVASQTRYAKAQANEGRAVRASWDISTPEKDKMRLHQPSTGFETPVLRPRAVEIARAEPNARPASQPHSNPSEHKPTPLWPELVRKEKVKETPAIREVVSPKRQKKPENKPSAKRSGTSNPAPAPKESRVRSDTDEEHLASMSPFFRPFSTVHRNLRIRGNRTHRATGTQARKTGDYEPTRSQGKHKG
jgi:hypothetical protein